VAKVDVRAAVLRRLTTAHVDTRFAEAYFVRPLADQLDCPPHQVLEALWGLVGEGLAYLNPSGQGSGTDNWRWLPSAAGIAAAAGGSWEPRDVDGYLRRLRTYRPPVGEVAIAYVAEALRAFNARCYLATSVMLGVASESVINSLGRAIVAVQGQKAAQLQKLLDGSTSRLARQFDEMRKQLVQMDLPDGLTDTLTLDAVADLLRVSRNNVGHPTGTAVDEDTAYTHLQMAARYLQKMTTLQAHLEAMASS
jgi:hypothetical protein